MEVSERTGLEYNPKFHASGDIIGYAKSGVTGLNEWIVDRYDDIRSPAGMLHGWKEAGFDINSPKIQALVAQKYSPEDLVVLYRGQGEWHDRVLSGAARQGGIEYSKQMLQELPNMGVEYTGIHPDAYGGDPFKRALAIHVSEAYLSIPDPFVAVTSSLDVARDWAGTDGILLEIVIPRSEVYSVADTLGATIAGHEHEWVIPHELGQQYITSHWGVDQHKELPSCCAWTPLFLEGP